MVADRRGQRPTDNNMKHRNLQDAAFKGTVGDTRYVVA